MIGRRALFLYSLASARFGIMTMADSGRKLPCSALKAALRALLSVCLLSLPLIAADDDQTYAEFHRLKTTYEKELEKFSSPDLEETVSEQNKYLTALKTIQKKAQTAGDLAAALGSDRKSVV